MKIVAPLIVLTAMLLGLPLLGAVLAGKPVYLYLEFSPVTRYVQHAEFSWLGFLVLGSLSLLLLVVLVLMYPPPPRDGHGFSRVPDIASLVGLGGRRTSAHVVDIGLEPVCVVSATAAFTFTPLWALLHRGHQCADLQTGGCLHDHPSTPYLLVLFPFSALFWWYFEYLNRFVQNWYSVGHETYTPLAYTVHATLAFSTVLPAVTSTMDLLSTYAALNPHVCASRW